MNKSLLLASLLVLSTLLAGCGDSEDSSAENEGTSGEGDIQELRLGHVWPSSELHAEAVQKFADEVDEITNGELSIEVYEDGTLGDDTELLEGLRIGSADIWVGGAGVLTSASDTAQIFTVPFMFDSQEHANTIYNGQVGQEITDTIIEDSGYNVLSYWPRGARWLTANQAVETPEDLQGLSIRVPDNPMFNKSFERMGAAPTPMNFGEVFTSIQQGVIDGQENPLSLIYNSRFQEVQDFLIETKHIREPITVVMSDETLSSLSEEHQEVLQQAANGTAKEFAAEEVSTGEEEYAEMLQDEGMKIIEPEIIEFQNELDGIIEEEFSHLTDLYNKIRDAGE
ncbi:TRAP transporter substrate-binding protein [Virgibacillus oceani]